MSGLCVLNGVGLWTAAVFLAGSTALANETIDCGYPLTEEERAYCAIQAFEDAEQKLNTTFEAAVGKTREMDAELPEDRKGGPAALEAAQDAWVLFREKDCTAYSFPFRGTARGEQLYRGCMIVMTMQRIEDLDAMIADYSN